MFIKVHGSDSPLFLAIESIAVVAYAPAAMFGVKSLVWVKGIPDGMPIKETPKEIIQLIYDQTGGTIDQLKRLFTSSPTPSEGNPKLS